MTHKHKTKPRNWRDTDEGYWIGVAEGMEAAAKIAEKTPVSWSEEGDAVERAAERIREAMTSAKPLTWARAHSHDR